MTLSAICEPFASRRTPAKWLWAAPILVSIAYYLGALAAFAIGTLTQQFAPFWPPNVVLLCALLLAPRRQWALYIAAAFPAHVAAEWGVAMPVPQLLAAFGCNVAVALLNAVAIKWLLRGPPWLGSLRNASIYLFAAVLANPAMVALAAGFEPLLGDGVPGNYWQYWGRWFLSNALGNLTLAPMFLAFWGTGAPRGRPRRARLAEALVLALGLIACAAAAFDTQLGRITVHFFPAMLYLPLPLLLAAAVRFGARGASGAILIVTLMVLIGTMHGHGPFANGPPEQNVLSVQLFLAIVAIPTLLLGALVEELRRANDRLSGVLDGISDCYYTLDRAGRITSVNAKGASWWGAAPADLIGRNYWQVTRDLPGEQELVRRALQSGIAARAEVEASDGRLVDVHAYPANGGVSVFYHDITGRRAAELAARATRELLQASLDALTAQIAILDAEGTIMATNSAWHKVAETVSQSGERYFVGANFIEECERGRPHQRKIAEGLRRLMRGEIAEFRFEYSSDFTAGAWLQLRGTRFGSGADLHIVVANEDITEVKASETALRQVTGRLLRSQDDERRRIARELHDSTAQNLLGASLGIGQALRLAPGMKQTARAALDEARELIELSQREIRTVSYLLHPPMLDEAGLPAALRWFCDGFAKRSDIAIELDIAPEIGRLPADIEAALFRVAQEALTNAHRHARSTRVRVSLMLARERSDAPLNIALEIADDGEGMPAAVIDALGSSRPGWEVRSMGIGLAGMRERLHQLGGHLAIRSDAGGTTLRSTAPLPRGIGSRPSGNPGVADAAC